jgi:hypothetical protein
MNNNTTLLESIDNLNEIRDAYQALAYLSNTCAYAESPLIGHILKQLNKNLDLELEMLKINSKMRA